MQVLDLLWPSDSLARSIIVILLILFAGWLLTLIYLSFRYWSINKQMHRCIDIGMLLTAIDKHAPTRDSAVAYRENLAAEGLSEDEAEAKLKTERVSKPPDWETNKTFLDFCKERTASNSVLSKHIRAIFNAGVEGNHLEVGELIQHSGRGLFWINNFLRSLLAIFIVVGLLGTLFGLAKSLGNLSSLLRTNEQIANEDLVSALQSLMANLETAFAPSIWGVGLTILGVVVFGIYLSAVCSPVKARLDYLTLTVWVPMMLPTVSQKQIKALQRSEERLLQGSVLTDRIITFIKNFDEDTSRFGSTMSRAEGSLSQMVVLVQGINSFSEDFSKDVKKLTDFQEDLTTLYNQIRRESTFFQNYVQKTINAADQNNKDMLGVLRTQSGHLQAITESLDLYIKEYAEYKKRVDAKSEEVLSSAQELFQEMGQRNRELIEELGKPLNETLTRNLGEIKSGLKGDLSTIADKIGNSIETIISRTERMARELREEFSAQNAVNSQVLQAQTRLSTNLEDQSGILQSLNSAITNLAGKVDSLNVSRAASRSTRGDGDNRGPSGGRQEEIALLRELIAETRNRNRGWFSRVFRGDE